MKTDREKLIEWIKDGRACPDDFSPFEDERCKRCKYLNDVDCDISRLADYLISKGVTIPVRCVECKECKITRLPDLGTIIDTYCYFYRKHVNEDDFCSYGERKDLNSSEKPNSWKDRVMNTFLGREK